METTTTNDTATRQADDCRYIVTPAERRLSRPAAETTMITYSGQDFDRLQSHAIALCAFDAHTHVGYCRATFAEAESAAKAVRDARYAQPVPPVRS